MLPCPFATPPPVRLELSAVLAVPTGPGVGVATVIGWPEGDVCPEADAAPGPAKAAMANAMQRRMESFINLYRTPECNPPPPWFNRERSAPGGI